MFTPEEIKKLTAPFPTEKLGVKVQSVSKDKSKAMLVLYLQHTDTMDRLDEVDPNWSTEVIEVKNVGDTVYVRMKMCVKGIWRENVGEGNEPKGAYSDALKRCAMLFGVGRYLYDSELVWVPYNESQDRYKQWTIEEYQARLKKPVSTPLRSVPSPSPAGVVVTPPVQAAPPSIAPRGPSDAQVKRIYAIGNTHGWAATEVDQYIKVAFGVTSRTLSRQQYDLLCDKIIPKVSFLKAFEEVSSNQKQVVNSQSPYPIPPLPGDEDTFDL